MEYLNTLQHSSTQTREQLTTLLVLLAPFAPHIAEELWHQIGYKDSVHNQPWPEYDQKLIQEKKIKLIIQINGKVRDVVEVASDISEKQAARRF